MMGLKLRETEEKKPASEAIQKAKAAAKIRAQKEAEQKPESAPNAVPPVPDKPRAVRKKKGRRVFGGLG